MLGKRKRDHGAVPRRLLEERREEPTTERPDVPDLFRQYFEQRFAPLPQLTPAREQPLSGELEPDQGSQSEESDWSGVSENDTAVRRVEVIEHELVPQVTSEAEQASEGKAFMVRSNKIQQHVVTDSTSQSSKPPVFGNAISKPKILPTSVEADDDPADTANLKKDLALQRLLQESHLLDRPGMTAAPTVNRNKVTDLRMQAAGAKTSLFKQEKMPLSHRKGIQAKKVMREDTRRRDAQENGIILERAVTVKQNGTTKRERGVGAPAVGRFAGGTLKLSRKDVYEINGPRQATRGKRKGRGR